MAPNFYHESSKGRILYNTPPVFYKIINNTREKMSLNDIRNPMIQPYDEDGNEVIINNLGKNRFVVINSIHINNNDNNNTWPVTNYEELFNSRSASPVSPVNSPKSFGKLPNFGSSRRRRTRRRKNRKL